MQHTHTHTKAQQLIKSYTGFQISSKFLVISLTWKQVYCNKAEVFASASPSTKHNVITRLNLPFKGRTWHDEKLWCNDWHEFLTARESKRFFYLTRRLFYSFLNIYISSCCNIYNLTLTMALFRQQKVILSHHWKVLRWTKEAEIYLNSAGLRESFPLQLFHFL